MRSKSNSYAYSVPYGNSAPKRDTDPDSYSNANTQGSVTGRKMGSYLNIQDFKNSDVDELAYVWSEVLMTRTRHFYIKAQNAT
jgi:hypothetical protein